MAPKRGARFLRAELGLAAASVSLLFLVLEASLRGLELPQRRLRPQELISQRRDLRLDCYPTNPHGELDIDLREPRSRERYRSLDPERYDLVSAVTPYAIEVRLNSLGFRDLEPGAKRPGVLRVAVLGDSFTEAQGVKLEDSYPRVLGRLLNQVEPGRWEVLNCGKRGADFPGLFDLFERVLALEPDVVVYGMVLNDAARSREFEARQPYVNDWILPRDGLSSGEGGVWLGLPEPRLLAFFRYRFESWRVARDTTRWYLDMYGAPNHRGWQRTKELIGEMDRQSSERGSRLLVAVWPLLVGLDGRYPFRSVHETIGRFCATAKIPEQDLLEAFAGHVAESLWVHPSDMHPNAVAHRLAAERLAPVVRALAAAPRRDR